MRWTTTRTVCIIVWRNLQMNEQTQPLYLNNAGTELLNQAKRFIPNTIVCEL